MGSIRLFIRLQASSDLKMKWTAEDEGRQIRSGRRRITIFWPIKRVKDKILGEKYKAIYINIRSLNNRVP